MSQYIAFQMCWYVCYVRVELLFFLFRTMDETQNTQRCQICFIHMQINAATTAVKTLYKYSGIVL